MIHYEVNATLPSSHLFTIRMTIPPQQGITVSMPNWIPGSYLIRDYARHIVTLTSFVVKEHNKEAFAITKINSNTWRLEKSDYPILIEYTVYAWDSSVRGAHLDENHAFFNPNCLCLQPSIEGPCQITINPPLCEGAKQWRVATTLKPINAKPWGFGTYQADSYDELIDHPVEMGNFDLIEFDVYGVSHAIVVSGKHDGFLSRLACDVQKICETHCNTFEQNIPFNRYLFLLTVSKDGYGGLEHRSSTALIAPRDFLPLKAEPLVTRNYINLLALFSHEYFHAWNVKRIKPLSFAPYNLNDKNYTNQLWAFEGITSYYDELALLRAKVISLDQYLDLLAQTLTKVLRTPGSFVQSVASASFDAWIKFYIPTENALNSQVSYYLKGSLIALAFDLLLRTFTNNQTTLDHIMKLLWKEFGESLKGVPEGFIESLIIKEGGERIAQFVNDAIYTTKILPMDTLLAPFGIAVTLRQQQSSDDNGGKRTLDNGTFRPGIFQFNLTKSQSRLTVSSLIENGAAMQAGISALDEIVAINDLKVDADSFDKVAKRLAPSQAVKVHFFRQDVLKETIVTLAESPFDTAQLSLKENISASEKNNLLQWLNLDSAVLGL